MHSGVLGFFFFAASAATAADDAFAAAAGGGASAFGVSPSLLLFQTRSYASDAAAYSSHSGYSSLSGNKKFDVLMQNKDREGQTRRKSSELRKFTWKSRGKRSGKVG